MKSRGAGINFRRHHSRGLSDPESIAGIRPMPLRTLSLIQRLYYVGRGSPLHFGTVQSVQDGVSSKDNRYWLLHKEEDPSVGPCSSHVRERS